MSGKVPVSGEKVLEKCHTNVTGKFRVGQQVNYMENVTTTKIRYEEASIESMVYYPGKMVRPKVRPCRTIFTKSGSSAKKGLGGIFGFKT